MLRRYLRDHMPFETTPQHAYSQFVWIDGAGNLLDKKGQVASFYFGDWKTGRKNAQEKAWVQYLLHTISKCSHFKIKRPLKKAKTKNYLYLTINCLNQITLLLNIPNKVGGLEVLVQYEELFTGTQLGLGRTLIWTEKPKKRRLGNYRTWKAKEIEYRTQK